MRRALVMSLALHALGLVLVAVAARPRLAVPPRLQAIPVDFILLAAPSPALTQRARLTRALPPAPAERPRPAPASLSAPAERARPAPAKPAVAATDPLRPLPRREPLARPDPSREEPKLAQPPRPKPQPDLPRQGSADPTQVFRSELPRVGDLRGAMQMRVEGEVLPYAYYLSMVQRKIAGFWDPPAGIEQQSGEVAAIVRFRIEKDGAVRSSYVQESSDIQPFDASALRALARSLPLPPLPQEYPGDYLIIHLRFVYGRETGVPAETR
jgi:periplasmic protein TonB